MYALHTIKFFPHRSLRIPTYDKSHPLKPYDIRLAGVILDTPGWIRVVPNEHVFSIFLVNSCELVWIQSRFWTWVHMNSLGRKVVHWIHVNLCEPTGSTNSHEFSFFDRWPSEPKPFTSSHEFMWVHMNSVPREEWPLGERFLKQRPG